MTVTIFVTIYMLVGLVIAYLSFARGDYDAALQYLKEDPDSDEELLDDIERNPIAIKIITTIIAIILWPRLALALIVENSMNNS